MTKDEFNSAYLSCASAFSSHDDTSRALADALPPEELPIKADCFGYPVGAGYNAFVAYSALKSTGIIRDDRRWGFRVAK